jgi:hypothetical protein
LPHFRRPAGAAAGAAGRAAAPADATPPVAADPGGSSGVTLSEAATLLPEPAHEGLSGPVLEGGPQRSGDIGAAVLNDLVDQIERDIEKDLGRAAPEALLPPYRGAVPCTFDPAAHARGPAPASPGPHRR